MITEYEVGQIPARPLNILINDNYGNPANLLVYTTFEIELLGSDNERVDLTGVELTTSGAKDGRFAVVWPKNRTLFRKSGAYLLRLVLRSSDGSRDYTTTHEIRVRDFGRFN